MKLRKLWHSVRGYEGLYQVSNFGEPHNLGYFNLSEYMTVIGNIHENPELLEHKG